MITITDKAKNKILLLRIEEGRDASYYLRVGVDGGGCSGLVYILKFDNEAITDNDTVNDFGDFKIIINKKSLLYLIGTELDYSDGLNGKGFVWNNPNSSRSCGCGESFAV